MAFTGRPALTSPALNWEIRRAPAQHVMCGLAKREVEHKPESFVGTDLACMPLKDVDRYSGHTLDMPEVKLPMSQGATPWTLKDSSHI